MAQQHGSGGSSNSAERRHERQRQCSPTRQGASVAGSSQRFALVQFCYYICGCVGRSLTEPPCPPYTTQETNAKGAYGSHTEAELRPNSGLNQVASNVHISSKRCCVLFQQ